VNIRTNADRFGLSHRLTVVEGNALDTVAGHSSPDVVFIGGGATQALLQQLWDTVETGTRIVANAVTLETETLLMNWHAKTGGHLLRVELAEAAPLGRMRGWTRARPVIQWSTVR
jgi:precorrin-6Y C5,15-methyltransferase (decarboxylating)